MIRLNDFDRQWRDTREAALSAFEEFGESGQYILGDQVRECEAALARHFGVAHCVGVGSGLDAIEISLKLLGCKPGDRVLTTPLSAFATTLGILKLGAIPVFVDTDPYGLIDLNVCRSILDTRPEIRYLVPVHLYGHSLNLHELQGLKNDFDCRIVEDCAQSISASFNGIRAGSIGHLAATSFYPTKNLDVMGDAGAILTGTPEFAEGARVLRDYGQTSKYRHDQIGYNSRLDELHASILNRVCLPRLSQWTARRRAIAARYTAEIRNPHIRCLGSPSRSESVWHLFPVLVDPGGKRDFMRHLKENGVASGEHYPILIPDQKALADVGHELIGDCPVARRICQSEVSLPIHPYLTEDDVSQVIQIANSWVNRYPDPPETASCDER